MVISWQCIRSATVRMTSMGQGAPAITPVRRLVRSNCAKSGWTSSAMNMVGHALECGGALAVHGFERGAGVELGGRQDQRGAGHQRHHGADYTPRSEERRVGKECRSRWS